MPHDKLEPTPAERGPLGEYLWNTRKALGWSLRKAEEEAKVSNAYISQMENGTIAKPSPSVLAKIASAYKAPYEHLMRLAGHLQPERSGKATRKGLLPTSTLPDLNLTEQEENEVREFIAFIRMRDRKNQ